MHCAGVLGLVAAGKPAAGITQVFLTSCSAGSRENPGRADHGR